MLSWNYDLLIESAIAQAGRPYHYVGVPTPCEGGQVQYGFPAITICKPHGSCNFGSEINFRLLDEDHNVAEQAYPRQINATAFDGNVKIIKRDNLLTVRSAADVVLPGEVNRFHRHLAWVDNAISRFAQEVRCIDHLVVVGFSMMDVDRDEFLRALGDMRGFRRISVVDPNPNSDMLAILNDRCTEGVDVYCKCPPDF
ncbi:MAG: SIR2 family protein [Rhodoferax sp.]